MDAEIKAPHNTISTTTSRHYFYRKATQPDLTNTVFLNVAESNDDFESRVNSFIQKDALQKTLIRLRQDATVDLTRRKAERKARKERERSTTEHRHELPPARNGPLFEKLSTLNPTEQNQWLANIHDDAMLMNPHQWLKLASLFNVNSKASRQQTLIDINAEPDVLKDRNIEENTFNRLENYMELRDVQNRNYARDAVAEGVKYTKLNRIKEAMEYYKRALDMDPKYADGWFHVAEGMVQQRKLQEAAIQLEKALKLEPEHEGAKALLASIRYTTQTKKVEKGDEWDLVDESGNGLSSVKPNKKSSANNNEEEEERSSKKKKKSSSSSYRSHRSSRRSSRSPESRYRSRESRHRRDRDSSSKRRERRSSPDDDDDSSSNKRRERRSSPDDSSSSSKRRERRSSPDDSRRHRRSHRSRSKESERTSRHVDSHRSRNRRDDSSPSGSRRHSRRESRDRESRHKRRHRSRSPSRNHSKRKRSNNDDDDDDTKPKTE